MTVARKQLREILDAWDEGVPVTEWEARHEQFQPEGFRYRNRNSYKDIIENYLAGYEVRRRPRTVTRTITYPEPEREAPENGATCFVVDPSTAGYCFKIEWDGSCYCHEWLARGLLHLTREAAETHGRALAGEDET